MGGRRMQSKRRYLILSIWLAFANAIAFVLFGHPGYDDLVQPVPGAPPLPTWPYPDYHSPVYLAWDTPWVPYVVASILVMGLFLAIYVLRKNELLP